MSADLHLHIFDNSISKEHMRAFFSSTLGSRWAGMKSDIDWDDAYSAMHRTPSIWVGSVSWFDDSSIPEPVEEINEIVGEDLPEIDDELIEEIGKAFELDDTSRGFYEVNDKEKVVEWLKDWKGEQVFAISW